MHSVANWDEMAFNLFDLICHLIRRREDESFSTIFCIDAGVFGLVSQCVCIFLLRSIIIRYVTQWKAICTMTFWFNNGNMFIQLLSDACFPLNHMILFLPCTNFTTVTAYLVWIHRLVFCYFRTIKRCIRTHTHLVKKKNNKQVTTDV